MERNSSPDEKNIQNFHDEENINVPEIFGHPFRLLIILTLSIFIAEMLVMFILSVLPSLPEFKQALIDASMLTLLILPVLYFLFYRPFRLHIEMRKGLEEKLREISITDELTGLLNRRGFHILAQKQMEISKRNRRKFSVLYLDLNNLKPINDRFGHEAGDNALLNTADILKHSFRTSDIVARVGGDEFIVLLTEHSGLEETEQFITGNIHKKFVDYNKRAKRGFSLSASMGISHYEPGSPVSIDEMLAQADNLMYRQKQMNKTGNPHPADYHKAVSGII